MDSISNEWLFDKVTELHDDADISDLRRAFGKQQNYHKVVPATVQVRETENGEMLKASTKLTIYVLPPADSSTAAPGPGKSMGTALFLTLPPQTQNVDNDFVKKEWSLVTGIIERNQTTGGCRHALFEIASGGYYPANTDPGVAFAVKVHPSDETRRLLSVSVVFRDERSAEAFAVKVDSYVAKTLGVDYYERFNIATVEPYGNPRLVFETDYIPNQADGDAPQDSPVWDIQVSGMDISTLSPTTIFSRSDTTN